ncbi:polypeptide N-acetylgalactosaminyltransferase 1-like [Branchiostoma lanceolatum]|uniref:polypeptide N-acetylgalactosaminyltransferase 1-like n=1 Tax=Branchiostoma lanceolatum TaxID=7740 RepID=UPI0034550E55
MALLVRKRTVVVILLTSMVWVFMDIFIFMRNSDFVKMSDSERLKEKVRGYAVGKNTVLPPEGKEGIRDVYHTEAALHTQHLQVQTLKEQIFPPNLELESKRSVHQDYMVTAEDDGRYNDNAYPLIFDEFQLETEDRSEENNDLEMTLVETTSDVITHDAPANMADQEWEDEETIAYDQVDELRKAYRSVTISELLYNTPSPWVASTRETVYDDVLTTKLPTKHTMENSHPGNVGQQNVQLLVKTSPNVTKSIPSTTKKAKFVNFLARLPSVLKKAAPGPYGNQYDPAEIEENIPKHTVLSLNSVTIPKPPRSPGEAGRPVRTKREDDAMVRSMFAEASFNVFVSNLISVERTIPDNRPTKCRTNKVADDLPQTSIIITFCEETWSTLIRTLHSIINRSPPRLVREIILVDDFSKREHLKGKLDGYIKRFPQIRIMRTTKREGLIRARMLGAAAASGEVLTFLDSHIECNVGWLEPLLDRIRQNRTNVVCPVIDAIDDRSFAYLEAQTLRGGMDWKELKFEWRSIPSFQALGRKDPSWPIISPTMAGGLFSIERSYFYELGAYDPELFIWGGENIEISFKIWMCGGRLEILPCSRVGHVFRKSQPYIFPGGAFEVFSHNTRRVAEVWLEDRYKKIFYALMPEALHIDYGNITEQLEFRRKCRPFKWYLENIYPDLGVPQINLQAVGEIRNLGQHDVCVDTLGGAQLGLWPCHGQGEHQSFSLDKSGVLKSGTLCVIREVGKEGEVLSVGLCKKENVLKFQHQKEKELKEIGDEPHVLTGRCLDMKFGAGVQKFLKLTPCDGGKFQHWKFGLYL